MSYTILTVPFDLREESNGEFLKKEFIVDKYLNEHFPVDLENGSNFLKVIEFSDALVKCATTRVFLKKRGADADELALKTNELNLFKGPSFISKVKYLSSISGYYKLCKKEQFVLNDEKSDLTKLTDTIINDLKFYVKTKDNKVARFKLGSMKLIVNRSISNQGVGYGYLTFQLEWDDEADNTIEEYASQLSSKADFYRWFNNPRDLKTMFFHDSFSEDSWNKKLNDKASKVKIDVEKLKITETNLQSPDGVFFHEIALDVLSEFLKGKSPDEVFNFNEGEKIKPFVLHLYQTDKGIQGIENEANEKGFTSNVYKSLRVPDNQNIPLVKDDVLDFKALIPDQFTKIYSIGEGAMIIKGNKDKNRKSEMVNDFYPAFLFVLNQKQLFHYCQNRINALEVNQNGKYKLDQLRRLRGMLVKAEFTQVFSAISNYNEIDSFYEDLREKFKVNDMRNEYMASVAGLSEIAELAEIKARESVEKQRDKRMNLLLLSLTLAQVWVGIFTIPDIATDKLSNNFVYAYYIGFALLFILGAYQALKYYRQKINKSNFS